MSTCGQAGAVSVALGPQARQAGAVSVSRKPEAHQAGAVSVSYLPEGPEEPTSVTARPRDATSATGARESMFMPFRGSMGSPVHPKTGPGVLR